MKRERPQACTDEHLEYLDELRASGVTNMFGAAPYLKRAFRDLSKSEADAIVLYWMSTFGERHAKA